MVALRALGVFRGITEALASCGVRIESPVTLKLLAWIRYVLCDSGYEVEYIPASLAAIGAPKLSWVRCVDDLLAFPDAADAAITPDGRFALVTSSGSNRLA